MYSISLKSWPVLVSWGEGIPYIKGRDAHREISNEPLKGTNLGVA